MKIAVSIMLLLTLVSCASTENQDKSPTEKKADLYYGHGTQALLEQDYTTALAHLQKAAELTPEDSKIQNNLGMAYFFKGEAERAITHLQKSIDLDKKNSDARVNLAGIYYSQGRNKLAYDQYKEVTKDLVYPHQYRTYYNMALIQEKSGQLKMAREFLSKSIAENKEYCPAHFFLGKMDEKVQQWASALEHYRNASKGQCYEEPAPHYSQALMLIKLNKKTEAREKLDMVMEKFSRTRYFAMASQELVRLGNKTNSSEEDFIQKARYEMDQLRAQEEEKTQTFQGTSF